jgi:hypothetical protein
MKKVIFIAMFSIALGSISFAQNWYAGVGGGYGFPVAGMAIYNETGTSYGYTFTSKILSYGKGFNFGGYGGYMFNKNVGAEIGVSYLEGAQTSTGAENYDIGSFAGPSFAETETFSATMLRIIPAVRFQLGEGCIRPYSVLGVSIGVATSAKATLYDPSPDEAIYSGGYSFGLHAAIGARIMLSQKIALYAELNMNYQNYSPAKVTDGVITVNYASSGTYYEATPYNTSQPQVYLPFSSLGVNVGVQISIGKQKAATSKPAATEANQAATPAK